MTVAETMNNDTTMKLILQHASNPDIHGGYWDSPVDPKRMTKQVETLTEARHEFNAWVDRNRLGGGNLTRQAGHLFDGRTLLGRFSFNGRFWGTDGKEITF